MFTSDQLEEGCIYTRNELRQKFNITDATLNTGIFQPSGSKSLWLFVTEQKPNDRMQYHDLLEGDRLYWEGQTEGRKDLVIIEHERNGLELLVFYRKMKYEFPGAGFRCEGRFRYMSHTGSHPTRFVLQRIDAELSAAVKDIRAFQIEEWYQEGKLSATLVNIHERNPKL